MMMKVGAADEISMHGADASACMICHALMRAGMYDGWVIMLSVSSWPLRFAVVGYTRFGTGWCSAVDGDGTLAAPTDGGQRWSWMIACLPTTPMGIGSRAG